MGFWPVVENVLRNSDILILVLDARMPELSKNRQLEKKIVEQGKELIIVFNKIDLISKESLKELKNSYNNAFCVSGTKNIGIKELRRHLQIMAKKMKIENPRIGVVGYPNLGKSAIINALARRARAAVADMPGTTRGTQWIKVSNFLILDSPGVIPYDDKSSKLLLLGSKHPYKTNQPEKIAFQIIDMFLEKNKPALEKKYNIIVSEGMSNYDIFLEIGKKRGYLKKGAEVDETKTAISIIQDWQKGKVNL